MQFKPFGSQYVVRLESGEEIITTLQRFCQGKGITAGWVMGIGAVRQATLGTFDMGAKQYHFVDLEGDHEITSLMGNISVMEGEIFMHLHATLGDRNFNVRGGHLQSGVISATGEIVVVPFEGVLERRFFEDSGLRLLALSGAD